MGCELMDRAVRLSRLAMRLLTLICGPMGIFCLAYSFAIPKEGVDAIMYLGIATALSWCLGDF